MLTRNYEEITEGQQTDWYFLTALNHSTGQLANTKRWDSQNQERWWSYDPSSQAGTRFSRIATSSSDMTTQWIGCDWLFHQESQNRIEKTTDGWVNSTSIENPTGLEAAGAIYSLAIESVSEPQRAIAVLSTDPVLGNSLDPHAGFVKCNGLYYTEDGGTSWDPVPNLLIPQDLYNVQLAMFRIGATQNFRIWMVGVIVDDEEENDPEIWCEWMDMTEPPSSFSLHSSTAGNIFAGRRDKPTYPFDLIAARVINTNLVSLMLLTSEKVYYAEHDGSTNDITWGSRMGTEPNVIRSYDFRKVANDPLSCNRDNFIIAGQICSYLTNDRGLNWYPIYQSTTDFVSYPAGGARQTGSKMVSLHAREPFSSSQTDYAPVFLEIAPRQFDEEPHGDNDRFLETIQIGYTQDRSSLQLASSCPFYDNGGRLYAAWNDPQSIHNGDNTVGVVYRSIDHGETWTPGTFLNRQFDRTSDNAPVPSSLFAHPHEDRVYIAFSNAGSGSGSSFVPPFAYSDDGGVTWNIPSNTGLPAVEADRQVVASTWMTTRKIYVAHGDELYVSQDEGENWSLVAEPAGGFDGGIVDITMQWLDTEYIGVATTNNLYVSVNGGATWSSRSYPAGLFAEAMCGDPEYNNVFWISLVDGSFNRFMKWTLNGGQSWHQVEGMTWSGEFGAGGPSLTDIYCEPDYYVEQLGWNKRIFWMGTGENTSRFLPSGDNPASGVRYKEFQFLPPRNRFPVHYVVSGTPGPSLYISEDAEVPFGCTLEIEPGVEVYIEEDAELIVDGTLIAGDGGGSPVVFKSIDEEGTDKWQGIYVHGSAYLSNCEIRDAEVGLNFYKLTGDAEISGCSIHDNVKGVYCYVPQVAGGKAKLLGNTISCNETGVDIFGSVYALVDGNTIEYNDKDGIYLSNSYAEISNNTFFKNGQTGSGFGVQCYGSSPVLYCNEFTNNTSGELALYNKSYPVLWKAKSQIGGSNTFLNDGKSLITMSESYPVICKGGNNFYLGSSGYFLEDKSKVPPKHDITDNYWNPTLSLSLLYPSSSSVWVWSGALSSPTICGSAAPSGSSGEPGTSFKQGIDAEMDEELTAALTYYEQEIANYPDEPWAAAAAARIFDIQRQLDVDYAARQTYFESVATSNATVPTLAEAADAFATRLWVENLEFDPALATYDSVVADTSAEEIDSIYALIDHEITLVRGSYEGYGGGSLDSDDLTLNPLRLSGLLNALDEALPEAPEVEHHGYVLPPTNYALHQNYPNPFNPSTTIRFDIPESSDITIAIYNTLGQHVTTLVSDHMQMGSYEVIWNGNDNTGQSVAAGMYIYQLKTNGFVDAKKMLLIK